MYNFTGLQEERASHTAFSAQSHMHLCEEELELVSLPEECVLGVTAAFSKYPDSLNCDWNIWRKYLIWRKKRFDVQTNVHRPHCVRTA